MAGTAGFFIASEKRRVAAVDLGPASRELLAAAVPEDGVREGNCSAWVGTCLRPFMGVCTAVILAKGALPV